MSALNMNWLSPSEAGRLRKDRDEWKNKVAQLENSNAAEWSTLMADVHDYFTDEKADRSRGRVTLILTLLGQLRIQRDEWKARAEKAEEDSKRLQVLLNGRWSLWTEIDFSPAGLIKEYVLNTDKKEYTDPDGRVVIDSAMRGQDGGAR